MVVLSIFISTMVLLTLFGERGFMNIFHLRAEREKIQMVNARLKEENKKLLEQIERLRQSKGEVEKIAREELGLVKKGEIVYQFDQ
jgi:cell division protein FtsB